jgi:succinylarginine dihydrolase
MVHTALAGKTNASKANAASALQRLLSAAKESLQTMLVILIWSGRRRLQLHSTWPQQAQRSGPTGADHTRLRQQRSSGGTSGMEGHSSLQPRWTPAAAAADPGRTALT